MESPDKKTQAVEMEYNDKRAIDDAPVIDPAVEKSLLRKLDFRVSKYMLISIPTRPTPFSLGALLTPNTVPVFFVMYFFNHCEFLLAYKRRSHN